MQEKRNKFFDFNKAKEPKKEEKLNELWTSKYIASHFQKIQSLENDLKLNISIKDSESSNELIHFLTSRGTLNHFVELIPSANDIFIQAINKSKFNSTKIL